MEKPKDPPTNLAVTGIYFLTPKIFEIFKSTKAIMEKWTRDNWCTSNTFRGRNKITYHTITDYWKDTGTPEDIINANKNLKI